MLAIAAIFFISLAAAAAEPSAVARGEIEHLLGHLERSGCQFQRNGSWYGAPEARAHLEKKYRYLLDKGLIGTAEDFIARAGSESSMSGKPYEVRCGSETPVTSKAWLSAELRHLRERNDKKQ